MVGRTEEVYIKKCYEALLHVSMTRHCPLSSKAVQKRKLLGITNQVGGTADGDNKGQNRPPPNLDFYILTLECITLPHHISLSCSLGSHAGCKPANISKVIH